MLKNKAQAFVSIACEFTSEGREHIDHMIGHQYHHHVQWQEHGDWNHQDSQPNANEDSQPTPSPIGAEILQTTQGQ